MTSERRWTITGVIATIVGVIIATVAWQMPRSPSDQSHADQASILTTLSLSPTPPMSVAVAVPPPTSSVATTPSPVIPSLTAHGGPLNVEAKLTGGAVGINKVSANATAVISLEVWDDAGHFNTSDGTCFEHIEVFFNGSYKEKFDSQCLGLLGSWYPSGTWRFDITVTTTFGQTAMTSLTLESV